MARGLPQVVRDNLDKCKAAAIAAVDAYNRPGPRFCAAHYIVLIIIGMDGAVARGLLSPRPPALVPPPGCGFRDSLCQGRWRAQALGPLRMPGTVFRGCKSSRAPNRGHITSLNRIFVVPHAQGQLLIRAWTLIESGSARRSRSDW